MRPPSVQESAAALGRKAVPIGSPLTSADYVESKAYQTIPFSNLTNWKLHYITLYYIILFLLSSYFQISFFSLQALASQKGLLKKVFPPKFCTSKYVSPPPPLAPPPASTCSALPSGPRRAAVLRSLSKHPHPTKAQHTLSSQSTSQQHPSWRPLSFSSLGVLPSPRLPHTQVLPCCPSPAPSLLFTPRVTLYHIRAPSW